MNDRIFDILPPAEDELLFSWVIRMLKRYNPRQYNKVFPRVVEKLFGYQDNNVPKLIWQDGLDYFAEHCNMPYDTTFSSPERIIERLSLLPFYSFFCVDPQINSYEAYFNFSKSEFFGTDNNARTDKYIYLCPECIKEQGVTYLKKEHQIKGNCVCWKHGCKLRLVKHKNDWNLIKDLLEGSLLETAKECEIDDKEIPIAKSLAVLIHNIFINGLKEDLNTIAEKLFQKFFWEENGAFLSEYNFKDWLAINKITFLPKYFPEKTHQCLEKVMKKIYYREYDASLTSDEIIIIIFLIYKSFGSLGDLYSYKIDTTFSPSQIQKDNYHSLAYYKDLADDKFLSKYNVLGVYKDALLVQHRRCGHIYRSPMEDDQFVECPLCDIEPIVLNNEVDNTTYIFYETKYIDEDEFKEKHKLTDEQLLDLIKEKKVPYITFYVRIFPDNIQL